MEEQQGTKVFIFYIETGKCNPWPQWYQYNPCHFHLLLAWDFKREWDGPLTLISQCRLSLLRLTTTATWEHFSRETFMHLLQSKIHLPRKRGLIATGLNWYTPGHPYSPIHLILFTQKTNDFTQWSNHLSTTSDF